MPVPAERAACACRDGDGRTVSRELVSAAYALGAGKLAVRQHLYQLADKLPRVVRPPLQVEVGALLCVAALPQDVAGEWLGPVRRVLCLERVADRNDDVVVVAGGRDLSLTTVSSAGTFVETPAAAAAAFRFGWDFGSLGAPG